MLSINFQANAFVLAGVILVTWVIDYTKSHLSSFNMLLIQTVLFTFYPAKKRLHAGEKDKDSDFMNVLLASKILKIIWGYDKTLIKHYVLFLRMMLCKTISLFDQT